MVTLSLVMIVKNEEDKIQRCIDSIKKIVDEIIIVDTGSTDSTKSIALKNGAKIFEYKWNNDFSNARNFSIKQSTSDWNLVLDADEYIVSNHQIIKAFIENQENKIGKLNILNKYKVNGQEMVESSFVSRLFPNKNILFSGRVHEQLVSNLPRINLPLIVEHDGYYQTDKTDRNLPLLLDDLKDAPNDAYLLYQIGKQYYLKMDFINANMYFNNSYNKINLDDSYKPKLVVDFIYSLMKSGNLESGLVIIEKEKQYLSWSTDFHFACGVFFMELVFSNVNKYIHYYPLIEQEYLKCLELGDIQKEEMVRGTGSFLALYNLGTVYETTGNEVRAIECYKKSAELKYNPAKIRYEYLMKK
jgi:glycosyltransferase involved in cell wall biosynthesis